MNHKQVSKRQLDLEQQLLEARLRQQQLQSEEDSKWLHQEESNLRKRLSTSGSFDSADSTSSETPMFAGNNGGGDGQIPSVPASLFDKDRSSTPNSSGSVSSRKNGPDDKSIIVKGNYMNFVCSFNIGYCISLRYIYQHVIINII